MSAFDSENGSVGNGEIQSEELCRCFSLAEIQSATNNFDDALVIGSGGFGKVYKGYIDDGSKTVAIKRLNMDSMQGEEEFGTEVKILSELRHTHLVALIGRCDDSKEMILVYEYIANGNLADHLYKSNGKGDDGIGISHLNWEQRLNICIGAARGLDYLHTGTNQSIIHRDVKTTNILLDEKWVPKISDFGLSKGTSSDSVTHVSTNVKGTFGYLDPDYFLTRRLTTKSDVYAFGVVLLEVLCGRPAVDSTLEEDEIGLVLWAQQYIKKGELDRIVDPSLRGQISPRSLKCFVKFANKCLDNRPSMRPTMAELVGSLELALGPQSKKKMITKVLQIQGMDHWRRSSRRESKENRSSHRKGRWDDDYRHQALQLKKRLEEYKDAAVARLRSSLPNRIEFRLEFPVADNGEFTKKPDPCSGSEGNVFIDGKNIG